MEKWQIDNFKATYGDVIFKCSSTGDNGKRLRFTANDFLDYCDQQNDLGLLSLLSLLSFPPLLSFLIFFVVNRSSVCV